MQRLDRIVFYITIIQKYLLHVSNIFLFCVFEFFLKPLTRRCDAFLHISNLLFDDIRRWTFVQFYKRRGRDRLICLRAESNKSSVLLEITKVWQIKDTDRYSKGWISDTSSCYYTYMPVFIRSTCNVVEG